MGGGYLCGSKIHTVHAACIHNLPNTNKNLPLCTWPLSNVAVTSSPCSLFRNLTHDSITGKELKNIQSSISTCVTLWVSILQGYSAYTYLNDLPLRVCQWQVAIVTHHPSLQFLAQQHIYTFSTLRKNTPAWCPDSVAAAVFLLSSLCIK